MLHGVYGDPKQGRHEYMTWSTLTDLLGVPCACSPPRVQILLFRHTKISGCNRLGSQRPPPRGLRPPTGNLGSAIGSRKLKFKTKCQNNAIVVTQP